MFEYVKLFEGFYTPCCEKYFCIICLCYDYIWLWFWVQILCQVKFVEPLMRSPIVSDEAFETMVKLARCTAPPLCDWALDISTALRLIVTDEVHLLLDLVPSVAEEEANERPHGLFERILDGLSISCKSGALPVDSFSFIFPVSNYTFKCNLITVPRLLCS